MIFEKKSVLFSIIQLLLFISLLISGCSQFNDGSVKKTAIGNNSTNQEIDKNLKSAPQSEGGLNKGGVLKAKVICIDAGHQSKQDLGKEPIAPNSKVLKQKVTSGTSGSVTKTPEYKLNLAVALLLKDMLEKNGATVIMIRETNDVNISNARRAEIANENKVDISIRIHANGSLDKSVRGVMVMYPGNEYIKDIQMLKDSKSAAEKILARILFTTKAVNRKTIVRNDLTGFNWSKVPVIVVEMGFMTNPDEDRLMETDEYREKMANGIMQGIVNYFQTK